MNSIRLNQAAVKRVVIGLAIACATASAFAQYAWIDEKGVKQYSDRPPPASTPASKILKGPRGQAPVSTPAPPTDAAPAGIAAPAKAPMTTAERNADFQKRKAEQEAKDKKAADEAKLAADKRKNCEAAQASRRALDSGERISRRDANGERAFLTDAERAAEMREVNQVLDACK